MHKPLIKLSTTQSLADYVSTARPHLAILSVIDELVGKVQRKTHVPWENILITIEVEALKEDEKIKSYKEETDKD